VTSRQVIVGVDTRFMWKEPRSEQAALAVSSAL
jgi:hypothetical protein